MFHPGERVFLPGAGGEPTTLTATVLAAPGIDITTTFVPGVNALDPAMIAPGTRLSGPFMHPALAAAQQAGTFGHLPMCYAAMLKWLRHAPPFDACVIQVAPPDPHGSCRLAPSAEFTPEVLRRARRIVAVVNPSVPPMPNAPSIPYSRIDHPLHADAPLVTYGAGRPDPASAAIAIRISALIPDGAALQVGLGKVPQALMDRLQDRRGLRLHSGMLSDGLIGLAEHGCLDPDWPHATTAILGSKALYDWVRSRPDIHLRGVEHTHDPRYLAGIEGFVAVNSALEVDVFGQCNLESAAGRAVSGAGGAPDFARAARLSPAGISIVALPATFAGGTGSRIVARLAEPGIASLPRSDVDVIVTEIGAADLRGQSVHQRAEAIIAIAAPPFRTELAAEWHDISRRL